ncbi:hypothetical protein SY91_04130 [Burkholderia cenocepacia]|nr:hypothetical protein SY91_04130 [Burkholderia cenocepacia]
MEEMLILANEDGAQVWADTKSHVHQPGRCFAKFTRGFGSMAPCSCRHRYNPSAPDRPGIRT